MQTATARAPQPYNREGRPTTERPSRIFVSNDKATDSTATLRLQFLAARYGVVGGYAALIAVLAFGGRHG